MSWPRRAPAPFGTGRGMVAVAGMVASAVLLTGCLSVPHSGKVQGAVGNATATGAVPAPIDDVRIDAAPPVAGEGPAQVVSDFYTAMVDYGSSVSQQYLVQGAAGPWPTMPTRTVVVDAIGEPIPKSVATATSATFEMRFTKVAEVLTDHEFVASASNTESIVDTVEVVRDAGPPDAAGATGATAKGDGSGKGEWRIGKITTTTNGSGPVPVDALRLSLADFNTVFHEATLYFPLAGKQTVAVADRRWFPVRLAQLPDAIANAYADGPSTLLTGDHAVAALLPKGTTESLPRPALPGQAELAFQSPQPLSAAQNTQLLDAVRATFSKASASFSDLNSVFVTVNQLRQEVQEAEIVDAPPTHGVADAWFIDSKSVLRPWPSDPSPITSVDATSPAPRFDVRGMSEVSLSPDVQFAAGALLANDGTLALRIASRNAPPRDIALHASALTSFRWNPVGGGVWIAGSVHGAAAAWYVEVAFQGDAPRASIYVIPHRITLEDSLTRGGGELMDLQPSPDTVRVSAIVRDASKKLSQLYVGRISIVDGLPAAVTLFRRVGPVLSPPEKGKVPPFNVTQAFWQDSESLLLVAQRGSLPFALWDATYDGSNVKTSGAQGGSFPLGPPTAVSATKDAALLAIDNASGKPRVWELDAAGWVEQDRHDGAKVLERARDADRPGGQRFAPVIYPG